MIIADTNIWIDFIRKPNSDAANVVRDLLGKDQLALVGVVLAEVLRGLRGRREKFQDLLDAVPFLEMSKRTWVAASRIAQQLDSDGSPIPMGDAFIAAVALEGDHEVFTHDKHFDRVPGLRLYKAEGV